MRVCITRGKYEHTLFRKNMGGRVAGGGVAGGSIRAGYVLLYAIDLYQALTF